MFARSKGLVSDMDVQFIRPLGSHSLAPAVGALLGELQLTWGLSINCTAVQWLLGSTFISGCPAVRAAPVAGQAMLEVRAAGDDVHLAEALC